jgi:hypothetical protein
LFRFRKEAGTAFSGENVTFVGVGKINATYNLLKAIQSMSDIIFLVSLTSR